ncbi:MgtC/SapB family protein [Pseudomonas frederiksbergensis]|uniref:MgtC/SapB family protein n=1 Tax=Pseudomonas frederiksbergensis TaxID=104087 RepID=UPI000A9A7383
MATIEALGFANAGAALGIGLLVGLERERRKGEDGRRDFAGLRTFAVTSLLGYVTAWIGGPPLLGFFALALGALVTVAYWKNLDKDPGITSEVALFAVLALGALCVTAPALATAVGVVMAGLLASRQALHHFARSQLTAVELRDGLMLLIAALVILPLAPDRYLGPYNAINLRTLCALTVMLMAVGALGHVAVRTLGTRYGYALGAIASGFASATMTVATMGHIAAKEPINVKILSAAAMLANLATLAQMALIIGAVEPALLGWMWGPLLCGLLTVLLYTGVLMFPRPRVRADEEIKHGGAFSLKLALTVVVAMTVITVVSSAMLAEFGQAGVTVTAIFSGLVDAHASTASIASLAKGGLLPFDDVAVPVLMALTSNSLSKCVVAWVSGGRRFAGLVIPGQVLMTLAMWGGLFLPNL